MKSFKSYLSEGVNDPAIFKAIFTAGGPGSGKSFVVGKTSLGFGLKVLSSDDILTFLLKKSGQSLNTLKMTSKEYDTFVLTREKASALNKKREQILVNGKMGLIIDGTGKNFKKTKKHWQDLVDMGYDLFMIFVNTSLEVAQERNARRTRKLKPEVVEELWKGVQENIGAFQRLFGGNNFVIIDNNDPDEDVFVKINKQVRAFIKQPLKSRIALDWIKDQKRKK